MSIKLDELWELAKHLVDEIFKDFAQVELYVEQNPYKAEVIITIHQGLKSLAYSGLPEYKLQNTTDGVNALEYAIKTLAEEAEKAGWSKKPKLEETYIKLNMDGLNTNFEELKWMHYDKQPKPKPKDPGWKKIPTKTIAPKKPLSMAEMYGHKDAQPVVSPEVMEEKPKAKKHTNIDELVDAANEITKNVLVSSIFDDSPFLAYLGKGVDKPNTLIGNKVTIDAYNKMLEYPPIEEFTSQEKAEDKQDLIQAQQQQEAAYKPAYANDPKLKELWDLFLKYNEQGDFASASQVQQLYQAHLAKLHKDGFKKAPLKQSKSKWHIEDLIDFYTSKK